MNYNIFGERLPAVTITLEPGESVYTEAGGMTWMTEGLTMETNTKGGVMKGLGRMMSGESLFMNTYTSQMPGAEITIASDFPGCIIPLMLDGSKSYICQKGAFLCATPGVNLAATVTKAKAGFFGGEGFVLQRVSGVGIVFLEIDGTVVERDLAPGERLKVNTGNIAAYEETVQYSAEMVKGLKNIIVGGEGLFLSSVTGPGKVYLQTITMSRFAGRITPFLPKGK